jgi:hypothetical protein
MRRFLAPNVRRSTGPQVAASALESVLGGYGIQVTTEELFAACGGTASGIGIDGLIRVACERGLVCDQAILPSDHLLQIGSQNVPSIVLMGRSTIRLHCVVLWQHLYGMVQVFDPVIGRRWLRSRTFLSSVHHHSQFVSARELAKWLRTPEFQSPLDHRISNLGISESRTLIANAACEPGWKGLACLDAVVRQTQRQPASRRLSREKARWIALVGLWKTTLVTPAIVPRRFWFARIPEEPWMKDPDAIQVRGAVVVRMRKR